MPDGSQVKTIEREAKAAAAEAAREAADEARAAAKPVAKAAPAKAASAKGKAAKGAKEWVEFQVNVWITDLNSVEFGIYKRSRNKAKSRQFTSDMDIFAEVIEDGERTGLLGFREDLWKKNAGMDKRLVFKLFNESLNWRATMDLMLARSLQLTVGARGLPVVAFSINTGDHDEMVYLERSANKWPFMPENYSFFLMREGRPMFYRLRRNLVDMGGDFRLLDERGKIIGVINGRVFSLGGHWSARIAKAHADPHLQMVLQLFCGMLAFRRGCVRHMKRLSKGVRAGTYVPTLEKQEADLYMNPRRVR
jgi:hypothetical protein